MTTAAATPSALPSPPIEVSIPVEAAPAAVIRAVIPCYAREQDLRLLLDDLAALDLSTPRGPIDLDLLVIDNASPTPLDHVVSGRARLLRLPRNTGGSGGFNAGLSEALRAWRDPPAPHHFLWLIDSDIRLRPDTLTRLLETLLSRPDLVAVGPALADPDTGEVFEVGGHVSRRNGAYRPHYDAIPAAPHTPGHHAPDPVICDYIASCCALVRRDAVERAGLMPDRFLNGDDVEWCIRLAHATGLSIACDPHAVALHPRFDRFPTTARFYGTRNAFGPLAALNLGRRVRARRAIAELGKAVNQVMMGRDDLARLHLLGLREAAAGRTTGPAPCALPPVEPYRPLDELPARLTAAANVWTHPAVAFLPSDPAPSPPEKRTDPPSTPLPHSPRTPPPTTRGILGALRRAIFGPDHDIAVVPAYGRPSAWLRGRRTLAVTPAGFVEREIHGWDRLLAAFFLTLRATPSLARLSLVAPRPAPLPRPPIPARPAPGAPPLAVCILSYNRAAALQRTLEALATNPDTQGAEIIVADNASTDGSPDLLRRLFPNVRLVELKDNTGVAGFNRAVELARAPYLLVLDDDARPAHAANGAPGAVAAAMKLLDDDPTLAAVPLHPRNAADAASEWPFTTSALAPRLRHRRWPAMGCANLVRRDAWDLVRGYDESFFLYRNDCDLAMKLLAAGYGIAFDENLVVWHDSPQTARKSPRWFELATRNWLFLARRHGRGLSGLLAATLGCAWAHRLAGLSLPSHVRVLRGTLRGLFEPRPPHAGSLIHPDGRALRNLLRLQLSSLTRRTRSRTPPAPSGPATADPSSPAPATPSPSSTNIPSTDRHSA